MAILASTVNGAKLGGESGAGELGMARMDWGEQGERGFGQYYYKWEMMENIDANEIKHHRIF